MKLTKKISTGILAGAIVLSGSISNAFAAVPVDAGMSPANETKKGDLGSFTKKLFWAGGGSSYYSVEYHDGISVGFLDKSATYYSTNYTRSYSKPITSSIKTWNTMLRVSNGSSATASGSVTLKDL